MDFYLIVYAFLFERLSLATGLGNLFLILFYQEFIKTNWNLFNDN